MKLLKTIAVSVFLIIYLLVNTHSGLVNAEEINTEDVTSKDTSDNTSAETAGDTEIGTGPVTYDSTGTIATIPETYNGEMMYRIALEYELYNNPTVKILRIPNYINEVIDWYKFHEIEEEGLHNYNSLTPDCPNLETVEVDKDNESFTTIDGVLYSKDKTILYYCPPGKAGELVVPEGVKVIDQSAFQECAKLTSIHLPATLSSIAGGAFGGNSSLTELVVAEANITYQSKNNIIYSKDGESLIAYAGGKPNKYLTIAKGVKEIRPAAFMGCAYLELLFTNENLTTIGSEAFKNCKALKSVRIAKGLRDINSGAFLHCSNLAYLNFPLGTRHVKDYALTGCDKLMSVEFPISVQSLPSDLYSVKGRTVKLYSLNRSGLAIEVAEGVSAYVYKNSSNDSYLEQQGVSLEYFSNSYSTVSAVKKAPVKAVKGKGKADTSWYKSSSKKFTIKNPDQLAGIAVLVNNGTDFKGKTVTLANDLDLSCYKNWTPIGFETTEIMAFRGTFNGNNHTIYNLRINCYDNFQGLFGEVIGTIKNLKIKDAEVSGNSYVGLLAGLTRYGSISNCSVSGKVNGNEAVGGLIGQSFSNIKSCSVDASVSGIVSVGGLIGCSGKNISECSNKGSVTGFDQVGGFIGTSDDGQISNLTNNMVVSGDINVGGLVGYISGGRCKIISCHNKTAVSGNENVGGISGSIYSGTTETCTNVGTVTGVYYTGGIVGELAVGHLKDCTNTAKVAGVSGVGGIIGRLNIFTFQNEYVIDCLNKGDVTGKRNVGDLIGWDE